MNSSEGKNQIFSIKSSIESDLLFQIDPINQILIKKLITDIEKNNLEKNSKNY